MVPCRCAATDCPPAQFLLLWIDPFPARCSNHLGAETDPENHGITGDRFPHQFLFRGKKRPGALIIGTHLAAKDDKPVGRVAGERIAIVEPEGPEGSLWASRYSAMVPAGSCSPCWRIVIILKKVCVAS